MLKKIPFLTFILLAIHAIVFAVYERQDGYLESKVERVIFESKLEKPIIDAYVKYLYKKMAYEAYWDRIEMIRQQKVDARTIYQWQYYDPFYQRWLQNNTDEIRYRASQIEAINEVNHLVESSGKHKLGYIPKNADFYRGITSVFLHGHWLILIVCMAFLGGICYEFEKNEHRDWLVASFIGGVILSTILIELINPVFHQPVPLGIGVVGFMFGVWLNGISKLSKSVAMLSCVVWFVSLAILYKLFLERFSLVIAGLNTVISSISILIYNKSLPKIKNILMKFDKNDDIAHQVSVANKYFEEMDLIQAKVLVERVLSKNKEYFEANYLYFKILKLSPASSAYHSCAVRCLSRSTQNSSDVLKISKVFRDYFMKAIPYPRLSINVLLHLLSTFRKNGYFESVGIILNHLSLYHSDHVPDDIAHEMFKMGYYYYEVNDKHRAFEWFEKCSLQYPNTIWGKKASEYATPVFSQTGSGGL